MKIYIPTKGRTDRQPTWDALPPQLKERAYLVCPEREGKWHGSFNRQYLSCPAEGISAVRQWIIENADDPFVFMMDDDQTFFVRQSPTDWHLRPATAADLTAMYLRVQELLEGGSYAHLGISARQGNNRVPELTKEIARQYNTYAYNAEIIQREGLRFDEVPLMEDFNMTLHLLRRGYKNIVLYKYAWNQPTSNASGGCSTYRTPELQERAARMLEANHPGFVKVVRKASKSGWKGMEERVDVTVYWKKAYESSKNN